MEPPTRTSLSPIALFFSLKRTSVLPKRISAPRSKRKVRAYGSDLAPSWPTACWIEPIRLSAWLLHRYMLGRRLPLTPAFPSAARPLTARDPMRCAYHCLRPRKIGRRASGRLSLCRIPMPVVATTVSPAILMPPRRPTSSSPPPSPAALNAAFTVPLAPEGGCLRWAPRPPRITSGVYNLGADSR